MDALNRKLLVTSAEFVAAQRAFDQAIREARAAGLPDEEIARLIGFSMPMLRRASPR